MLPIAEAFRARIKELGWLGFVLRCGHFEGNLTLARSVPTTTLPV
jgi:hypothetical protein